jgi:hypothetical protein
MKKPLTPLAGQTRSGAARREESPVRGEVKGRRPRGPTNALEVCLCHLPRSGGHRSLSAGASACVLM